MLSPFKQGDVLEITGGEGIPLPALILPSPS